MIRILRAVVALSALVGIGFVSVHATSRVTSMGAATSCTVAALDANQRGATPVSSVQRFGCAGDWAYEWATLGTGPHAIGVTQLLESSATGWHLASRLHDCTPAVLPAVVYRGACFSN